MARTYNESRESLQGEGFTFDSLEDIDDLRDIPFPLIARPIPDNLQQDLPGELPGRRRRNFDQIADNISTYLEGIIGQDIGDLEANLSALFEQELDGLGQTELLRMLVETLRIQTAFSDLLTQQSITQLTFLNDIATAVESPVAITVSGVNEIEQPDDPIPVIPNSDDQRYEVTELIIRADPNNTRDIYIGDDNVQPDRGLVLQPGESETVELDFRISTLWMASAQGDQLVQLLGWL